MSKAKTRTVSFDEVRAACGGPFDPGVPTLTEAEFRLAVTAERVRRLRAADPNAYVVVPETVNLFTSVGFCWTIMQPLPDGPMPTDNPVVNYPLTHYETYCGRRAVSLINSTDTRTTLDENVAEDLAAALTLGRAARTKAGAP